MRDSFASETEMRGYNDGDDVSGTSRFQNILM